jgi:hypothetical protein
VPLIDGVLSRTTDVVRWHRGFRLPIAVDAKRKVLKTRKEIEARLRLCSMTMTR